MINNILKYTKNLICFAVSSLLLLSISYADFDSTVISSFRDFNNTSFNQTYTGIYDSHKCYDINSHYYSDPITYATEYNDMITALDNAGYGYLRFSIQPNTLPMFFVFEKNHLDIGFNSYGYLYVNINNIKQFNTYLMGECSYWSANFIGNNYNIGNTYRAMWAQTNSNFINDNLVTCSQDVKLLTNSFQSVFWDGSSYIYQTTPPAPSYIPTNEEIAEKVQDFYNSDFFQNQSDFKDYFVLYNYNNETFSFIGHNLITNIGQIVYRANFPQNTTGVDYWRFYLVDPATHIWNWFNNYYWLYTTTLDSDTITYTGKGAVTDLLDLKFNPTYSTIVYSTTDYPSQIYGWDDTNHEITVESETVSGDSYTYDENIDPTTSEYNPITNYVLPNSIDTLISNADIPGLLQIWVTPDFSNMHWIFLSISTLWGYFGGFVLLTAIMFFIMWLLRG